MALLGNLTGSAQFFNSTEFHNGVATQSLRFDDGSSAYLGRTPSSASNRKTFTFSGWVKRGNIGTNQDIFNAGVNNGSLPRSSFRFKTDDTISIGFNPSATTWYYSITTRVFRDVSSWYHLILSVDTTQSTSTNRVKLYVNGELQTFASQSVPSQNTDLTVNNTVGHSIGVYGGGNRTSSFCDVYMAEVNFVDGNAYDASYFGETKNGVWIAKKYTGSYGTNGFRLQFNQTGTGTASASTIGADTSGNTNHWTSSGIVASDCAMPDSPENNFATMNPLEKHANITLSEGNLKSVSSGDWRAVKGTQSIHTGKRYFEAYVNTTNNNLQDQGIGLAGDDTVLSGTSPYPQSDTPVISYLGSGDIYRNGSLLAGSLASFSGGNVLGVAVDFDNSTVQFYLNNSAQSSAQTLPTADLLMPFHVASGTRYSIFNFGQDSSFAGNKTAQGNTDGNGIGDFYYAPPSGFLALCTSNLPEPTISPNADTQADDHFNTLIYDGNDDATRTFDIGFVSDWSWFKARNASGIGHQLYDSSRGVQKYLATNTTTGDSDNTEGVTSFNSSGLLAIGNSNFLNKSGRTHVLWNWKANGGTTSSNTDGSITSTVQANTTAGFSIVTFTGNGSNDATIGHGLSTTPAMIITKNRADSVSWRIWHKNLTANNVLFFTTSGTIVPSGHSNGYIKTVGSSTYSVYQGNVDTNGVNGSSDAMIAYCFAEVEGYSKFGSYEANNSTDGPFLYLGFKPALIILKPIDQAVDWFIFDNKRDIDNAVSQILYPSSSSAEGSASVLDFVSNGVKIRNSGSGGINHSGTYIYMAFAETPTKYSLAR